MKKLKKIGIFDSGIGGLSIAQELLKIPGLELIYYADTAHVPYGNRTQWEIQELSYAAIAALVQYEVDAVIIACHTVVTNALEYLKTQFPSLLFIDVVDLLIQQMSVVNPQGSIGILGTSATIATKMHAKKIQEKFPQVTIFMQPCPQLAHVIEYEFENRNKILQLVQEYIHPLRAARVETILLACTHYPLIQEIIQAAFEYEISIISAEQILYEKFEPYNKQTTQETTIRYFSTGSVQSLETTIKKIMPSFKRVQH